MPMAKVAADKAGRRRSKKTKSTQNSSFCKMSIVVVVVVKIQYGEKRSERKSGRRSDGCDYCAVTNQPATYHLRILPFSLKKDSDDVSGCSTLS